MKVVPVPVREDNYAYLLIDDKSKKAAAVDPYTVSKVKAAAEQLGVQIVAAITTHHHFDHSGGNQVRKSFLVSNQSSPFQSLSFGLLSRHRSPDADLTSITSTGFRMYPF